MRHACLRTAGAVTTMLSFASLAQAGTNLVANGDFETTTATSSQQVTTTNIANWSSTGYNFIYLADPNSASGTTADTTGATGSYGVVKLWGPGDGSNNGLMTSPTGGNFLAADDNFGQVAISQVLNGLTVGEGYSLSFYWAAAQQAGYDKTTQEQFQVMFGNETQSTNIIYLPGHAFSGWTQVTMSFVANATSQTLSFLATGTPGGMPPFSLLDGVSLVATPEPAAWAVLTTALMGFGVLSRIKRRKPKTGAPV